MPSSPRRSALIQGASVSALTLGASTRGRCWGCRVLLNASNNSEAHIIPNALGGRLKPEGILCRTCNGELDLLADNALVAAFGAWPTLLDLPRDHRPNPPKSVVSESGHTVRVTSSGPYTVTDVRYDKTALSDGASSVTITAPIMKIARQKIRQAAKEFPHLDPAEAERHARVKSLPACEFRGNPAGDSDLMSAAVPI
jgi:HNH endonuclease